VLKLRRWMQKLLIRDLSFDGKDLVVSFDPRTKVSPERLVRMAAKEPKRWKLTPDNKLKARVSDRSKVLEEAKGLLALLS
jgi:transcription-repair coupling factor (superfamily II helicase)